MKLKYIDLMEDAFIEREGSFHYDGIALCTAGCGCCSETKLVTPENLAEAITNVETFLNELKQLRDKLYGPPTNT